MFLKINLQFKSPLLLSTGSVEYTHVDEILHSDTIKSALFACAMQLGKDDISFFNKFLISSAFPYVGKRYFLPKPFFRLPVKHVQNDRHFFKKLKKVLWIEKSLFEKFIAGHEVDINEVNFSQDGKFLYVQSEDPFPQQVYMFEEIQRVTVKYGEDAIPFFVTRMQFSKQAGLYVLVKMQKETDAYFDNVLKPAFRLLGDNGLGSYKNLGNGHFLPEFDSNAFEITMPNDNFTHLMNLSLYCPTKEEIEAGIADQATYQLLKRGGYVSSTTDPSKMSWRKKSVYMFHEGSVFPKTSILPEGKLVDLTPQDFPHPIKREGRPIFIRVIKNTSYE